MVRTALRVWELETAESSLFLGGSVAAVVAGRPPELQNSGRGLYATGGLEWTHPRVFRVDNSVNGKRRESALNNTRSFSKKKWKPAMQETLKYRARKLRGPMYEIG